MEWRDQGALLSVRRHGENSAIIELLTAQHGRHAGIVRGATSRKMAPHLQPGTQLDVTWRARLEGHLGSFTVEPLHARAGVLGDRAALAALNAVTGLLSYALPEREPHDDLYALSVGLMDMLDVGHDWHRAYLAWELALLDALGYGLDLSACAVTGARDGLVYVSPNSGRAVTAAGAGEWADRMLPLPDILRGGADGSGGQMAKALQTTGHFLTRFAADHGDRPVPAARQRLIDLLARLD